MPPFQLRIQSRPSAAVPSHLTNRRSWGGSGRAGWRPCCGGAPAPVTSCACRPHRRLSPLAVSAFVSESEHPHRGALGGAPCRMWCHTNMAVRLVSMCVISHVCHFPCASFPCVPFSMCHCHVSECDLCWCHMNTTLLTYLPTYEPLPAPPPCIPQQHDDIDERVWTSAFGCLVALLCDHEGALDPADLGALPPSALAALAEAAAGHRWCELGECVDHLATIC